MPNCELHCIRSKERYGYEFRELHKWMDELWVVYGSKHRILRHDPYADKEVEAIFLSKVPENQKQNIKYAYQDHILYDYLDEVKNRYKLGSKKYKIKVFEFNSETFDEDCKKWDEELEKEKLRNKEEE